MCRGNLFHKQYVFFAHKAFTPPVWTLAAEVRALLVDLPFLDEALAQAVQ